MDQQPRSSRSRVRSALSVFFVFVLAGLLFTANARLAGGEENRQPEDFAGLVRQETERGDELQTDVEMLRAKVDVLSASLATKAPALDATTQKRTGMSSGLIAVQGPGLRVTLTDAPTNRPQAAEIVADDLVVHQQDLEGVINALWAGGAEAMTLQGERVTALTAFRCVGNVLSLHGRVYSPPYVVEAIGNQAALTAALDASHSVTIYREYVDAVGLGYDVETFNDATLPAFTGVLNLDFARVPEGTDIYR